jgi:cation transport regulator
MADNLGERGTRDSARINVNQPHELRYWAQKLGVTEDALRKAVERSARWLKRSSSDRETRHANMPYNSIDDLPKAQTNQYNDDQKEAFLKAFNNAYKEYGGDEHRAFAVAHAAAKRAGERPGPG